MRRWIALLAAAPLLMGAVTLYDYVSDNPVEPFLVVDFEGGDDCRDDGVCSSFHNPIECFSTNAATIDCNATTVTPLSGSQYGEMDCSVNATMLFLGAIPSLNEIYIKADLYLETTNPFSNMILEFHDKSGVGDFPCGETGISLNSFGTASTRANICGSRSTANPPDTAGTADTFQEWKFRLENQSGDIDMDIWQPGADFASTPTLSDTDAGGDGEPFYTFSIQNNNDCTTRQAIDNIRFYSEDPD